ncbi:MAG: metallophosphoesterase family protein [bacterium]
MRTIYYWLIITALFATGGLIGCGDDDGGANTTPGSDAAELLVDADPSLDPTTELRRGPYLQAPSPGTVTVSWCTDEPTTSRVEYGPAGEAQTEVAGITFIQQPTTDDPILYGTLPETYQHEVTLEGLVAGQRYTYRVLSAAAPEPEGSFVAPPDPGDDFRFFLFGDTRTHTEEHQSVIDLMAAEIDADGERAFVVHTGDMVNSGGLDANWDDFFEIEASLLSRTPMIPVYGNHEAMLGRTIYEGLMKAPPSTTGGNDRWFSVDIGDIHIATLEVYNMTDEPQLEWLEQDLAASAAPFKFVLVHSPLFTFSNHLPNFDLRDELLPILEATGVQLVLSGHNHLYERFFGSGIHFVVSGGGGAPLYGTNDNPEANNTGAVRQAADESLHYVSAELTGTQIQFEAIAVPDATPIDCFVIDSEVPGAELPCQ